ncbi:DUF7507 domain-containing protein [Leptolyngbya iicbica]|nr:peptidoglycan-binding protein [Leptolyngbya sp. LK]
MTHYTNTPTSQSTTSSSLPTPNRQLGRQVAPSLQKLLTLSTGSLLLSTVAKAQAQSAVFCPLTEGQLPLECADRSLTPDEAQVTATAINQPDLDRPLNRAVVPTFSAIAAAPPDQASHAESVPQVEAQVAIAASASPTPTSVIASQPEPMPAAIEAASVDLAVENLQKSLNRAGFAVEVNGVFDQPTQTALQQFKAQRGLNVVGIAATPEQTNLVSAMPAGYSGGQSLLLVQNSDDESSESAPENSTEAADTDSDSDADATDTPPAAETEAENSTETETETETPAAEDSTDPEPEAEAPAAEDSTDPEPEAEAETAPNVPEGSEDVEDTDTTPPDTSADSPTEDDTTTTTTDEGDDTTADEEPSGELDTDPSEGESTGATDDRTDAEAADDAPETNANEPTGADTPAEDTPAATPDRVHAPTPEASVDKSGSPAMTPRSTPPADAAKKPDEPGGNISNTATGTSRETPPQGASADVPVTSQPVFGFNKTVTEVINPDGSIAADNLVDEAGDTIKYTMRVSNFGNVTLTGVAIADPLLKAAPAENVTLRVGEELFFQGEYTATQADIDGENAYIHNEASFSSHQTSPKTDGEAVPIRKTPALTVDKQATNIDRKNDGQLNAVGDIIDYSIVVTNTGNQTLTNVQVNDGLIGNQTIDQLAPSESKTFLGQYKLTQQDIDSNGGGDGDIDNSVIAKADQVPPAEAFAEVELQQKPALAIEKRVLEVDETGDGVLNNAGEKIHYEVIVTNTGNQTLNNVIVTDPLLGGTVDEGFSLSPGASKSYKLTYTITQADLDNGGAPLNAPEFLNPSQP